MYKPLTILVDIDDTLSNFIPTILDNYNKIHATNHDMSIIDRWEIPKELPNFWDALTHEMLQNMPLKECVYDTLKEWHDEGHKIVLVSAIADDTHYMDKVIWSEKMRIKEFITDIIPTRHKYLIRGDVFIDDYIMNILEWSSHNKKGVPLLMTANHNKNLEYSCEYIRVNDWKEIKNYVKLISHLKYVNEGETSCQ